MAGDFKLAEAFVEIKQRGLATTKRGLLGIKRTLGGVISGFGMLGRAIKRAFSPMRLAMAGIAGAFAIRGLLKLASDAEEVGSKFDAVFKNMRDEAEKTARNVARYMGASLTESKKAIGDLGDLFKPLGFAEADALKLSAQMVKLAADISSFSNMPMDEALTRLRGTLVGSHENALAFGVVINENTLKAEMARLGTDKLTGAMKEQAKVAARLSLLMRGTADAQGDLARTSDSFANSMKRMKSLLREVGELVGKTLIPVFQGLGNILSAVAEKLRESLTTALPKMKEGLEGIKALLDGVAERVRGVDFSGWGAQLIDAFKDAGKVLVGAAVDAGKIMLATMAAIGKVLLTLGLIVGEAIGEAIVKGTKKALGLARGKEKGEPTAGSEFVRGVKEGFGFLPIKAVEVTLGKPDPEGPSAGTRLASSMKDAFGPGSAIAKMFEEMASKYQKLIPDAPPAAAKGDAPPDVPGALDPKPIIEAIVVPQAADKKPDGIAVGMHSFASLWSSVQDRISKGEAALLVEAKKQLVVQEEIAANTKRKPAAAFA